MRRMLCSQDPARELETSCERNKGLESSHHQGVPFGGHTFHWAFPGRSWSLSGQWYGKLWTQGRETGWGKLLSWRVQAVLYGVFSSLERIFLSGCACQGAACLSSSPCSSYQMCESWTYFTFSGCLAGGTHTAEAPGPQSRAP